MQDAVALLETTTFSVTGRPPLAAQEHQEIIAAIAARDPERAKAAAHTHYREALRARLKSMQGSA